MKTWDYSCTSYLKVRELIDQEIKTTDHCVKIMQALEECCNELTPSDRRDWDFFDEFGDLKSEIHESAELMDSDDYETCEDTVNYYLSELYDLCDAANVWLEICQ